MGLLGWVCSVKTHPPAFFVFFFLFFHLFTTALWRCGGGLADARKVEFLMSAHTCLGANATDACVGQNDPKRDSIQVKFSTAEAKISDRDGKQVSTMKAIARRMTQTGNADG